MFSKEKVREHLPLETPATPTFRVEVMATKKAAFVDGCSSEHVVNGSKGCFMRQLRTRLKSQSYVGALICRKRLINPFRNLAVAG